MHLIARTTSGLAATEADVAEVRRQDVKVWQWPVDLGDLDHLETKMDEVFSKIDPRVYEKAFLFNNAGSLGPLTFTQELADVQSIRRAVDMNMTSYMYLTATFTRLFGAGRPDIPPEEQKQEPPVAQGGAFGGKAVVVNVSSLAAIQAFSSWGVYCAGKAGRDMFMSVVAKEQEHADKLKTLNYAPGPMDTAMQGEVREAKDTDRASKQWFIDMFQQGKLVCPRESAAKCVRILLADRYQSGVHIDYYDAEP